ncbi:MAG TPA: rod shape-determining protein MreC [Vicinamibacterales bacterium]
MIEIHRRTGYLLLAMLLAQIILISAQVTTSSGTRVLQAVTFGVFSQVQLGTAWVFGGFRAVWDGVVGLRNAHAENRRLREELMAVRVRLQEQQALALRGIQLEGLLELKRQLPLRTVAANVIARDGTGFQWRVTIDRGSADGLRKDMAVLAPTGVVGRILEQPPLYAAKVQLLIDREAGAGALIRRTQASGVVLGHDQPGRPALRMDYVSNLADVRVGDEVVTSGFDGIYPSGFTIGTIASVERGSGLYKEIWVNPAVDFAALESVLVVLDPPTEPVPDQTTAEAGESSR